MKYISLFLILIPLWLNAQPNADGTIDRGDNLTNANRLEWWAEARFGMFIHWGLYAQDGCFWNGQDGRSEHMMLTSKHHDDFARFKIWSILFSWKRLARPGL